MGACLGVASCLLVNAAISPELWGFTSEVFARSFLITNAVLCFGLARLMSKGDVNLT
jgi:serine protease